MCYYFLVVTPLRTFNERKYPSIHGYHLRKMSDSTTKDIEVSAFHIPLLLTYLLLYHRPPYYFRLCSSFIVIHKKDLHEFYSHAFTHNPMF